MTGKADLYMKDVISHMMTSHNPATWPHTINLLVSTEIYYLSILASYSTTLASFAAVYTTCPILSNNVQCIQLSPHVTLVIITSLLYPHTQI